MVKDKRGSINLRVGVIGQDPRKHGELHQVVVGSPRNLIQVHEVVEICCSPFFPVVNSLGPFFPMAEAAVASSKVSS